MPTATDAEIARRAETQKLHELSGAIRAALFAEMDGSLSNDFKKTGLFNNPCDFSIEPQGKGYTLKLSWNSLTNYANGPCAQTIQDQDKLVVTGMTKRLGLELQAKGEKECCGSDVYARTFGSTDELIGHVARQISKANATALRAATRQAGF